MFKKIGQIESVHRYCISGEKIFYLSSDRKLFLDGKYLCDFSRTSFLGCFEDHFFVRDFLNPEYRIFDNIGDLKEEGHGKSFYPINENFHGVSEKINSEVYDMIVDKKLMSKYRFQIDRINNYVLFINDDLIFYLKTKNLLSVFSIQQNSIVWEYNLKNLGQFVDLEGDEKFVKVIDIKGLWNDQIIVALNNYSIISIGIENGELHYTWKDLDLKEPENSIYRYFYTPDSFVLDSKKGELIGTLHTNLIKVDLKSKAASRFDIKDELAKHNIISFKQLGIWHHPTPIDEDYLYARAELKQRNDDGRWSYDALIMINRETMSIDWIYPFEKDNLGTNIPRLNGDKLYQLDTGHRLHVFEKTCEN